MGIGVRRAETGCRMSISRAINRRGLRARIHQRALCVALGMGLVCAPAMLHAQAVSISSANNQVFHVNDPSTAAATITVTDITGGNIKFNRDIRVIIPTGFNMTWDPTVTNVTLGGNAAARCATAVTYGNGNLTVTINVLTTFVAGDYVTISGLKFTNFTATSPVNNLSVDLKNNPGVAATDSKTIQILPYYNVAVTPASTSITSLPTNGASLTATFTVSNTGAVSDSYDLLTSKSPGTAVSVVSISGAGVTQGALPDSARSGALASGGAVIVTVTYKVGNVAAGTIDTLKLTGRSLGNTVKTSTGVVIVTVVRPALAIAKSVSPGGNPSPGTNLTFTSTLTNSGSASASSVAVIDSIPNWVDFKTASAAAALPAGVTAQIQYSNDGGVTWAYSPISGGCSAPTGFDRCVNRIRWLLLAALSSTAPNNSGTLSFVSRIR